MIMNDPMVIAAVFFGMGVCLSTFALIGASIADDFMNRRKERQNGYQPR